jgi:hypothetical protein
LKTKNINNNNEANDEVNHDINFISNAIILTSIRYHVDRFTANQLLSNDTEMDINNYTNGNNKKRDRNNIGNDISIINDSLGKCSIEVNPLKIDFIKKHFSCQNFSIHLSLSDEKNSAIAMVIIENKD